jgi:hypothetical protein
VRLQVYGELEPHVHSPLDDIGPLGRQSGADRGAAKSATACLSRSQGAYERLSGAYEPRAGADHAGAGSRRQPPRQLYLITMSRQCAAEPDDRHTTGAPGRRGAAPPRQAPLSRG